MVRGSNKGKFNPGTGFSMKRQKLIAGEQAESGNGQTRRGGDWQLIIELTVERKK
jgi:hypothetical protein